MLPHESAYYSERSILFVEKQRFWKLKDDKENNLDWGE